MPRKPKKGYFVRGHFVAEGSTLDQELKRELKGGIETSKTDLKRESAELQALGESLLQLRADLLARLELPETLLGALAEARRISNFEGRRRQMQYVGKLMRRLDAATLDAARRALDEQARGPAQDTARLHALEQWRQRLIDDDTALGEWMQAHPATEAQPLRALVRQARKDFKPGPRGEAPRQGKAYRELLQLLRARWLADEAPADDVGAPAADPARPIDPEEPA